MQLLIVISASVTYSILGLCDQNGDSRFSVNVQVWMAFSGRQFTRFASMMRNWCLVFSYLCMSLGRPVERIEVNTELANSA